MILEWELMPIKVLLQPCTLIEAVPITGKRYGSERGCGFLRVTQLVRGQRRGSNPE